MSMSLSFNGLVLCEIKQVVKKNKKSLHNAVNYLAARFMFGLGKMSCLFTCSVIRKSAVRNLKFGCHMEAVRSVWRMGGRHLAARPEKLNSMIIERITLLET
jgi:hypothetical protein